jgi:hypothetical protein
VTKPIAEDTGVLPSWLLVPTLVLAAWAALAPFALAGISDAAVLGCFTAPGAVAAVFALADWMVWRRRRRPWHDWTVIVLLLPAIGAAVWLTLGGIVEDLALTRNEVLGLEVGPGMALVGLLATTVSYHGRHHPAEKA